MHQYFTRRRMYLAQRGEGGPNHHNRPPTLWRTGREAQRYCLPHPRVRPFPRVPWPLLLPLPCGREGTAEPRFHADDQAGRPAGREASLTDRPTKNRTHEITKNQSLLNDADDAPPAGPSVPAVGCCVARSRRSAGKIIALKTWTGGEGGRTTHGVRVVDLARHA